MVDIEGKDLAPIVVLKCEKKKINEIAEFINTNVKKVKANKGTKETLEISLSLKNVHSSILYLLV